MMQGMEITDIKNAMEEQGWTATALAKELEVTPEHLSRVLSGKVKMPGQLKKLIEYTLGIRKSQMMMFTIELPDEKVSHFVPGWENLKPEERQKAGEAVLRHMFDELIDLGRASLTPQELAEVKRIAQNR